MKKLIIIIIFSLFFPLLIMASEWEVMNSPVNLTIYSVCFIDNNTGFISVEYGIYKTTNAGVNWRIVYQGSMLAKKFVFIGSIGYAPCFNLLDTTRGGLLKTTNTGESWLRENLTNAEGFTDIFMKSISEIYVSSFDGLVFKTTDGGIIWSSSLVNNGFILCGIGMINNQLYALEPNNFHKQVDSFWMWQGSTGINCWGDFSVDPKDGSIYAGGVMYDHIFPGIAKTNTQGGNWQVFPLREDTGSVRELIFLNQGSDYAVGEIVLNQQALYGCIWSKNLNHSWEREYVSLQPTGMFGFLTCCKTDHYIYVVGGNGIMIRKNILLSNIIQHEIKNKYSLSQNYPNPFNPVTKIQYHLPKNLMVTIKIFDMLGKEIQTLVNQNQVAGTHRVYFDGSNLSSGIYFYKITAGEFTETKKMILVK